MYLEIRNDGQCEDDSDGLEPWQEDPEAWKA